MVTRYGEPFCSGYVATSSWILDREGQHLCEVAKHRDRFAEV